MAKSRQLPVRPAVTGAVTLLVGAAAFIESFRYPLGSIGQIGPAVFPLGLSVLLIIAGIAIIIEDLRAGTIPQTPVPLASLLTVAGGPIAFALLVAPFGLIPAIVASVMISALADRSLRPLSVLLLATGLALGCTLVFITFLKMPIAPIDWPF